MHTITLGGIQYPIQATAGMMGAARERLADALADATEQAEADADARGLDDAARGRLVERRRKAAHARYMADSRNSLAVIADLVNGAVERERLLNGRDISGEVPHYPLTVQKLALLATAEDLNGEGNSKAIAAELAAWMPAGEKKEAANHLMAAARTILTG